MNTTNISLGVITKIESAKVLNRNLDLAEIGTGPIYSLNLELFNQYGQATSLQILIDDPKVLFPLKLALNKTKPTLI